MTRIKQFAIGLVAAGLLFVSSTAASGEISGSSVLPSSNMQSSYIDGAKEPERMPDRVRYGVFVKGYLSGIQAHLVNELSAKDDAILVALAMSDEAAERNENALYEQEVLEFCLSRHNRSALALARQSDEIVTEYYQRRVARYISGIGSLSPQGRRVVDTFIDDSIVPHSKAAVLGDVAWAKEDPADYLASLEVRCHVAETGALPEGIQQRFDEYVEERKLAQGE